MDRDIFYIKSVLKQLEEKGVDSIYQMIKGRKLNTRAISCYDQLINDLITSYHFRNYNIGQNKAMFAAEVKSLCWHYLSLLGEDLKN